jgi:hypothetical protein
MNVRNFYDAILETLQGRTETLKDIPSERLDWAGPGALLELYREAAGNDRDHLIRAMGQVIQEHPASPEVIAQLIQIASGLDIAQVEPQVRKLQEEPFAAQEPLHGAIANYLAFRNLNAAPKMAAPVTRPRANGKAKTRNRKKKSRSIDDPWPS